MKYSKKYLSNLSRGQAMILATVMFLAFSLVAIFGIINPVLRHLKATSNVIGSKQGYYLAESGMEDFIYRMKSGKQMSDPETFSSNSGLVTISSINTATGKEITAVGDLFNFIRKVKVDLVLGTGISFHYGIQAGNGGFLLQNSSSVTGNVFSDGPVIGAGNYIYGDVVSSGVSGLISGIHATGTAYSHTIQNSTIDKDAFYTVINSSTVGGISYPGSADQPPAPLPISDAQISDWETQAAAGTVIDSCPGGTYSITSSRTLGPAKINCNLLVKGNTVELTIAGPVWVAGNITTQTGPLIKMQSGLGSQNVALIADNPADRTGSSIISIGQNTAFEGSGTVGSFVFAISQNNDAETGGTTNAIDMGQSAGALVVYASHGQITLGQSVGVKEVTAYKIILTNTANVTYDTGLPSVLFSSGPSGGYDISRWREVE